MMAVRLDDLFDKERLPNYLHCIPIICYFPLGCSLAVIRFFIGIQAILLSVLLSKVPPIRWIMCVTLGFIVFTEGDEDYDPEVKIFVMNHVTNFDHLAMNLILPVVVPSVWDLPPYLNWVLGYKYFGASEGRQVFVKNVRNFLKDSNLPILTFPEGATTNNKKGLLKFNSWPFFLNQDVQPIVLKVRRPVITRISPSILGSRWWSDMLWFLFVPFTVFTIKFLPVIHRTDFESAEAFCKNVQGCMCEELSLEETNFTSTDKVEHAKLQLQSN